MSLTVPVGSTAEVHMPTSLRQANLGLQTVTETTTTVDVWPLSQAESMPQWMIDAVANEKLGASSEVVITVRGGSYVFSASYN